jgi:hypothetical protein
MTFAGSTTTNNANVLAIPPGYRWTGSVALSGALSGAIGASAVSATPAIVLSTTGTSDPVSGTVLARTALSTPAIGALSLVGTGSTNSVVVPVATVWNTDGSATLNCVLQYNSATAAAGVMMGELS